MSFPFKKEDAFKLLLVRPDRIGDVLLSTPAAKALKENFPKASITFWVRNEVAPLLRGLSFLDEVTAFDPGLSIWEYRRLLKPKAFDAVVFFYSHSRAALGALMAGIAFRVGPLSKPHSFLCFNHGIRQRRSRVRMHEAQYNLELLQAFGISPRASRHFTEIGIDPATREEAGRWLQDQGRDTARRLVAVHPGMGGSAVNWPEENYYKLVRLLAEQGWQVMVTAGPAEEALLRRYRQLSPNVICYGGLQARSVDFLAGLFTFCDLVIAPSTGPLHIAVALGKPVVSFYPSIRVQSARRWGPYAPAEQKIMIFEAPGNACSPQEGMKKLKVEDILKRIQGEYS